MLDYINKFESNLRQIARNTWLSAVILLVVGAGCAIYTFDDLLHTNGDNAVYIILGESLADGTGYRNMHSPAETFHGKYPPVLPALIAGVSWISAGNFFDFKIMIILFYLGSVLAAFWAFRPLSEKTGFLIALLLAVNFYVVDFGHWIMSEIPCLFLVLMSVGYLLRVKNNEWKIDLLAGIFCALTLLTRTASIFLLPPALIYYISRKNWKGISVFSTASVGPVFLWSIFKKLNGVVGGGYTNSLFKVNPYRPELGLVSPADILNRIIENFNGYFGQYIPSMAFPGFVTNQKLAAIRAGQSDFAMTLIAVLITATLFLGLWKFIKAKNWLFALILISGGGLLLIWPSVWMTQRFVIPLFPFILLAGMQGLSIGDRWDWGKIVKLFVFVIVVGSSLVRMNPGRQSYHPQFANYVNASRWIGRNTLKNDIISCRKGEFTYLFSKRKCVGYKYSLAAQEVINHLREKNVKFVIVDQLGFSSTPRYLVPAIKKNEELFNVVYKTLQPENWVLQLKDEL